MKTGILGVLVLVGWLTCMPHLQADDWPQWRGPKLDSVSAETGLPEALDPEKNLKWRVELPGSAGSSPIVANGHVFVTSADSDQLKLICYSVDGTKKWERQLPGTNRTIRMDAANLASPSPSSDGKHVWAMMGNGQLACFTVAGEKVWEKDLQDEYGEFDIQFGMSSTPLLYEGKLYLALMHGDMRDSRTTSEGQVICLDAATGKQHWMRLRKTDGTAENKHSYASPTITIDSQPVRLITHGADYVIAHSIDDGSEIWRCGGFNPKGDGYNSFLRLVASPTYGNGTIYAPTAKNGPVLAIKLDAQGDVTNGEAVLWRTDRVTPDVATPVVQDGLVYLAGERGVMTCLDASTGETYYRERLMADKHRSTPVFADGKVFIADRQGTMYVLQAGKELKVLSKIELGEETTASPAISDGCVYIRTFAALYCFSDKK